MPDPQSTIITALLEHLALRQTERLISSILQLLGLDLPVPDFSTLRCPTSPPSVGGLRAWNCRRSPAPPAVRSTCWSRSMEPAGSAPGAS